MNNTISDFKAAKGSMSNVVLAFYIKNLKKQCRLWIVKVKFHVFLKSGLLRWPIRDMESYSFY